MTRLREKIFSYDLGGRKTEVRLSQNLPVFDDGRSVLHVFDDNTAKLFPSLPKDSVVLAPGEDAKTWESVQKILNAAFSRGLARDSLFVGVGGGVVCDVVAFAASVFMRGARLCLVPTSLLAMVDAAFGGKTAVNFEGYKNMVGSFFPAESISLHPVILSTLPRREFFSGLAEVIKAGMLGDETLFSILENKRDELTGSAQASQASLLYELIERSLLVKARFVVADPTEKGIRAHLNLGHTFAHGLESATGFSRYTHGEAVAWGILRALDAGTALGLTRPVYTERARRLLAGYGYTETVPGVNADAVMGAITLDKKKKDGRVRFVLQKGLGDTFLSPLEDGIVRSVVLRGLASSN